MPTYKLYYFNGKGRAEIARILFAASNQTFADERLDFAEWPKLKPSMPCGQLPVLEIDGTKIPQSHAIARHLAREFNLYGNSKMDKTNADVVVDSCLEVYNEYVKTVFEKDESKLSELVKKFEETATRVLPFLQKLLERNTGGNGFIVGNSLTVADLIVFTSLEDVFKKYPKIASKFPKLVALRSKVGSQPRIAEYLKKRPETDF